MMKMHAIVAAALALAGALPASAVADVPRPACAVRDKAVAGGVPGAACDALARHLAADHPELDPAALRLALSRASPRVVSGRVERIDGTARGPTLTTDAQDGKLTTADLDHFAQNALALFLFR